MFGCITRVLRCVLLIHEGTCGDVVRWMVLILDIVQSSCIGTRVSIYKPPSHVHVTVQFPSPYRKTPAPPWATFSPTLANPSILTLKPSNPLTPPYLLLKYQLKASPFTSSAYGVGTSASPGLATGCLKYTAEHTLWCTSRYLGMNANALM